MRPEDVHIRYILSVVDNATRNALAADKRIRDSARATATQMRSSLRTEARGAAEATAAHGRLNKERSESERNVHGMSRALRTLGDNYTSSTRALQGFNTRFMAFRNLLFAIRWPAMITGIGLFAQGMSAAAAAAGQLAAAVAPLGGLLAALPAAAAAAAQGFGVLKLGFMGIGDALKALQAEQTKGVTTSKRAAKAHSDAADQIRAAERRVSDAKEASKRAEENLTKARSDAKKQLVDLALAAEGAANSERRAQFAVQEAFRDLQRANVDPNASNADRENARLNYEDAITAAKQAGVEKGRARRDMNSATKDGVKNSNLVKDAQRQVRDAARDAADAARDLKKAGQDAADGLGVADAAAEKVAQKMGQLSPAGREFTKFIWGLKPGLDKLQGIAQEGLLPGVQEGIENMMPLWKPLQSIVKDTAGVFGDFARDAGKMFGSAGWVKDFTNIGKNNVGIFKNLGGGLLAAADGFRHITAAAQPFLKWLSRIGEAAGKTFGEKMKGLRENGGLARFFDRTRRAMEAWWGVIKPMAKVIGDVLDAAFPSAMRLVRKLGDGADKLAAWTGSVKGKNALKDYFHDMEEPIEAVGGLLTDIFKMFIDIGRPEKGKSGLTELIAVIRHDLLPVLGDTLKSATETFGPALIRMLGDLLNLFKELHSPLTIVFNVMSKLFDGFAWAIENLPLFKELITALLTLSALRRLGTIAFRLTGLDTAVAKMGKLSDLWKGLRRAWRGEKGGPTGPAGSSGGPTAPGGGPGSSGGRPIRGPGGVDRPAQQKPTDPTTGKPIGNSPFNVRPATPIGPPTFEQSGGRGGIVSPTVGVAPGFQAANRRLIRQSVMGPLATMPTGGMLVSGRRPSGPFRAVRPTGAVTGEYMPSTVSPRGERRAIRDEERRERKRARQEERREARVGAREGARNLGRSIMGPVGAPFRAGREGAGRAGSFFRVNFRDRIAGGGGGGERGGFAPGAFVPSRGTLGRGAGTAAVGAGRALGGIGKVGMGVGRLAGAAGMMGMGALGGPVGILLMALPLIIQYWPQISKAATQAWNKIKPILEVAGKWIKTAFVDSLQWVKDAWGNLKDWISTAAENVYDFVKDWGIRLVLIYTWPHRTAFKLIRSAWNALKEWIPNAAGNVVDALGKVWGGIKNKIWHPIRDGFRAVKDYIEDFPKKVSGGAKKIGSAIGDAVEAGLSTAGDFGKKILKFIASKIDNAIPDSIGKSPLKINLPNNPLQDALHLRGGGWVVPGDPGSDSTIAALAGDEVVLTGSGQGMMERYAPGLLSGIVDNQLPHFAKGGSLPGATVATAARRNAGLSGTPLVNMVAISRRESTWVPTAHNYDPPRDDSWGLWQINVLPQANPKYKSWNLTDPNVNARAMGELYRATNGSMQPWRGPDGDPLWHAREFLPMARAAVKASRGGGPTTSASNAGGAQTTQAASQSTDKYGFQSNTAPWAKRVLNPMNTLAAIHGSQEGAFATGQGLAEASRYTSASAKRQAYSAAVQALAAQGAQTAANSSTTQVSTAARGASNTSTTRRSRSSSTGGIHPGGGWEGSEGIAKALASQYRANWGSQKRAKMMTANGNVSDHWTGNPGAYAIDMPPGSDKMFHDIAAKAGVNAQKGSWNIFPNKPVKGYRTQILWYAPDGSHRDHVHLGVKKLRRGGAVGRRRFKTGGPINPHPKYDSKSNQPFSSMRSDLRSSVVNRVTGLGGKSANRVNLDNSQEVQAYLIQFGMQLENATIGVIERKRVSTQRAILEMRKGGVTDVEGQKIGVLQQQLDQLDLAAGNYVGKVLENVEQISIAMQRKAASNDRLSRESDIDTGSAGGLAFNVANVAEQGGFLRQQQGVVRAALRNATKSGNTTAVKALTEKMSELDDAVAEAGVALIEAQRAAIVGNYDRIAEDQGRMISQMTDASGRALRRAGVDSSSAAGLTVNQGVLDATQTALENQRAVLVNTMNSQKPGTATYRALYQQLEDLNGQIDEVFTQRLENWRAVIRTTYAEATARAAGATQMTQIMGQRNDIQAQLDHTFDTAAGRQQRADYIRNTIVPQLGGEVGALSNEVSGLVNTGASQDEIQAKVREMEAKRNEMMQAQLDAQNLIEENTRAAADRLKEFTGSIGFEYRGQGFTDLVGFGTGA